MFPCCLEFTLIISFSCTSAHLNIKGKINCETMGAYLPQSSPDKMSLSLKEKGRKKIKKLYESFKKNINTKNIEKN